MSQLITEELVELDLSADTKDSATRQLAELLVASGRVTDLEGFLSDVAAREAQMPTGLEGGIGIPHCRSEHVTEPSLAFGRAADPVDFGADDGPADLVFLIAAPAGADSDHLSILSSLARSLAVPEFTAALRQVSDPRTAAALIRGDADDLAELVASGGEAGSSASETGASSPAAPPEPSGESAESAAARSALPAQRTSQTADRAAEASGEGKHPSMEEGAQKNAGGPLFRVVAVTSCPTGIAHTYMAAESLERAAEESGGNVEITVETQGSAGFARIDPALIAAADAVIFAHDVEVRERERFAGKPTVDVGVKAAINRPAELVAEARAKAERGEVAVGLGTGF
ncbi:fructose PTS transporter subunit IIB, partial [Streptomyces cacaoi]|uniref:fructose PTS transporter subunit IIB n=1 Tax=Streptomyces cacaoi TaxID=1898 RepID=UPI0013026A96